MLVIEAGIGLLPPGPSISPLLTLTKKEQPPTMPISLMPAMEPADALSRCLGGRSRKCRGRSRAGRRARARSRNPKAQQKWLIERLGMDSTRARELVGVFEQTRGCSGITARDFAERRVLTTIESGWPAVRSCRAAGWPIAGSSLG